MSPLQEFLALICISNGHFFDHFLSLQRICLFTCWAFNVPHQLRVVGLSFGLGPDRIFPLTLLLPKGTVVHLLLPFLHFLQFYRGLVRLHRLIKLPLPVSHLIPQTRVVSLICLLACKQLLTHQIRTLNNFESRLGQI